MQKIYKEKVNLLREAMQDNKAKFYAIMNHPLASQEDYYRDLYLKMLCLVAHYSDGMNDSQLFLLQRIILGVAQETSAQEYIRRATEADEEFLEDFIEGFRTEELRFAFVVDCLVLSAIGSRDTAGQLQFIAELSEQLQISAAEIKYLALLSQSIIEQNHDKYTAAEELRPDRISAGMFYYYTKAYVKFFITTGPDLFSMIYQERTLYNFEQQEGNYLGPTSMLMRKNHIHLENMIINTADFQLIFEACEQVELINCEFIGSANSLTFNCCKELLLEKCVFHNFKTQVLVLEDISVIKVISCNFDKCVYIHSTNYYNWQSLGAVFYSNQPSNIKSLLIDNCTFKESGGRSTLGLYASEIISNCTAIVKNSKFINCWNYYRDDERDPVNTNRTLFPDLSVNQNNEIIGSANFS
ncbi:hypothetical protein [Paenibacillus silagei]|uniref:Pentapeptide repeat-containing protein n=1 Tax=Paenibacillus silagei TaxID=1670801 RepID=A0ABS4NVL2_9BACL|nr:hypothetical protein [Paenibacillus silagei]MBP2114105.1 hypothetical protein [Paenibacillus silagei]